MPAITVDDTLVLPRIPRPDPATSTPRPIAEVITAHRQVEGAGFSIRRPFPGELSSARAGRFKPLDVLLLGGLPIRAPIAQYGPFVMNTREEMLQAIEDYEAGRLGIVPADQLAPRNYA